MQILADFFGGPEILILVAMAGAVIIGFVWLVFPFLVLGKMREQVQEIKEQSKVLRQMQAELIESNQWAAARVGFTDEVPNRFKARMPTA
jgi:hypothetical protein